MDLVQIDYLAVFIAIILNMIIGYVWFSKWLFGEIYAKKTGVKKMRQGAILMELASSFVIAFLIAFFELHLKVATVSDGIFVGFCLWLGFAFTTESAHFIWRKDPFDLFLINTGYRLLGYTVMGGVIGA